MFTTRVATRADALSVGTRLREADKREIDAASGLDPLRVTLVGLETSVVARTAVFNDVPVAIYGVVPLPGGDAGFPWLLATDGILECRYQFLAATKPEVRTLEVFPSLRGWVHAANTTHIAWIKWSGFTLAPEPQPYGRRGEPFIHFWKDCHV